MDLHRKIQHFLDLQGQGTNREFSEFLSQIEAVGPSVFSLETFSKPKKLSFRLGLTGPPGAGKSTLINGLIEELRKRSLKVGVLAVDPTSPFSSGALLGDRIRYNTYSADENVFIRSVGSRGSLGGLSGIAYLLLRAFDHWNFDITLVETVGVGQTELEVMNVADCVCVVLVPESGDSVQAMKAGLLEIADFFVVNKMDRPGADVFAKELKTSGDLDELKKDVFMTEATENRGVLDVVDCVLKAMESDFKKQRQDVRRLRAEASALLQLKAQSDIQKMTFSVNSESDLIKLLK